MSEATTAQDYNNAPLDASIEDGFQQDHHPRDQDSIGDETYNENYQHRDDDDNEPNNENYSDEDGYDGEESGLFEGRTIFTKSDQEVEGRKLFIGNLDFKVTTAELKDYFSTFGDVEDAVVMNSKSESGQHQSRGFGFVVFKEKSVATSVANDEKLEIHGAHITAHFARPRSNQNITRLFVGSIPANLTEQTFIDYFEKYGKIEGVQISPSRNNPTGDNNIAFITFADTEAAQAALKDVNHTIGGVPLRVSIAKEKSAPRSKSSRGRGGSRSGREERRPSRYRDGYRDRRDGYRGDRDYRDPSRKYRDERPSYRGRDERDTRDTREQRRERDPRTPDIRHPRERDYGSAPYGYDNYRDEARSHYPVSGSGSGSDRYRHEGGYERSTLYRDPVPDRYRDSAPAENDRFRPDSSRYPYHSGESSKYYGDDRLDSYGASSRPVSSRGASAAPHHGSSPYVSTGSNYPSSSSYPSSSYSSSSYPQEVRELRYNDFPESGEAGAYSSSRSTGNYAAYPSYQTSYSGSSGSGSTSQSHYSSDYRGR